MHATFHQNKKATMTKTTNAAAACLAAAALLASPALLAQDAGWYAGGSLGRSGATIDDGRIRAGLGNQGLVVSGMSERDDDMGYKLFGGYQINRWFGIEASWFDLGEAGFTANTTPAGTLTGDVRTRGLGVDLVGTLPLGDRFFVLGRVGVAHARTSGNFSSTGAVSMPYASTSTSANNTGIKFGAGVGWRFNEAWSLRAEAERFRMRDGVGNKGDIDLFSIGVVYRFGGR